jgi:hypothetical protein
VVDRQDRLRCCRRRCAERHAEESYHAPPTSRRRGAACPDRRRQPPRCQRVDTRTCATRSTAATRVLSRPATLGAIRLLPVADPTVSRCQHVDMAAVVSRPLAP